MTPLLAAAELSMGGRLRATDLQVAGGTLMAVVGPNGSGKTSLLRALARIDHAGGGVLIDGEEVDQTAPARRSRLLSFLPAARDVPWSIAARDVVALGLSTPDHERVEDLLTLLDLREFATRPIDRLSTGERARVLLARALAPRPRALLLDEPLSNLDPYWALRIVDVLASTAREGSAVIVSLHDLGMLERFDRALLMASGAVVADAAPEQLLRTPIFAEVLGVEPHAGHWRIRRS